MTPERKLVIIGLMGAGKSTVAGTIASRFGVSARDTDAVVEANAGMSVADVFATHGEAAFRDLECDAVRQSLRGPDAAVVSLGGGAYMNPAVRDACRAAQVVYLHATPDALIARLRATQLADRPLLTGAWEDVVRRMYDVRHPVYATANAVIETTGRSASAVANSVMETWEAAHV